MVGQRIGPYEITETLGSGGMGEVYKANDTRLERLVAVKAVHSERRSDPSSLSRFAQEARAASALNHPNIVTVYDVIEEHGATFLVMEYVKGQTLDQVISRKGLRLRDALNYATQIADALAAAHAAGIVHRDIKPANIIVSAIGRVKILDFGLAKPTPFSAVTNNQSTRTAAFETEEGTIVGSVAYMSPEQAEGKPVDARSDIFSFGAVFYEMLTGRRAFEGTSRASVIAAVLKEEPRLPDHLGESLPREVHRIVMRCLRKDVDRRSQSMAEIKLALDELRAESESGSLARPASPEATARKMSVRALFALGVLAAACAIAWIVWKQQRPAAALSYTLRQITYDDGVSTDPALSPDGKFIVYASDRANEGNLDLWVQQVAGGRPVRLTTDRADDIHPSFSPDGNQIVFTRRIDGIYTIPALGGQERLVAKGAYGGSYSPDGKWIAYVRGLSGSEDSGLFVAPTDGTPHRKLNTDVVVFTAALWRPDSGSLIVGGTRESAVGNPIKWYSVPIDGGLASDIDITQLGGPAAVGYGYPIAFISDDHLLIASGYGGTYNVWKIVLSSSGNTMAGVPHRVTAGSGEIPGPPSRDGRIPYSTYLGTSAIYRIAVDEKTGVSTGEPERVLSGSADSWFPTVTADRRMLSFVSDRGGAVNLWLKDLVSGGEKLIPSRDQIRRGLISPDGSRVAVIGFTKGKTYPYIWSVADGQQSSLCQDCRSVLHWTSDGRGVLVAAGKRDEPILLDLATGRRRLLARHPKHPLHDFVLSRDMRWLAFRTLVTGNVQTVYISPVLPDKPTEEQQWIQISGGAPHHRPFWSADGNLLYFYAVKDNYTCLYGRRLDSATRQPKGEVFAVRHFHGDLRPVPPIYTGYGLAGDNLYTPLSSRKGNVWIAEPEEAQ